jgi:hypothetical protein
MLCESSAFHLVPFHRKKKTALPGLTRAAAHSVSPTFAQSNATGVPVGTTPQRSYSRPGAGRVGGDPAILVDTGRCGGSGLY